MKHFLQSATHFARMKISKCEALAPYQRQSPYLSDEVTQKNLPL
jgi:hypothetical protein